MPATITKQDFVSMLNGAVAQIRTNEQYLSKLDAAIGDGDHGTTIRKVMDNLAKAVAESSASPLKDILFNGGMAAASTDGGSSAPLIGSFFMGMADPAEGKDSFTAADVAAIISAGIEAVKLDSKAQIGDKTMMDALLPVLELLKQPAPTDIKALLVSVQETARNGATATKEFRAKFGRSRNLGDRVIGHEDAGANSIAFIFQGMCEAI